ncbi:polysaccharide pyruvyl transferase family protein [Tsukamurella sp. PLM1]|uniref:polysaccharide pyruvyl transferase family protein n=1 Tax=Tsukamurella sp. PLM1 TaxID=2929795 RepID=UPI0020BDA8C2|nr:polysaccharide pyruvyl transferase family protein [Tsukamurella sp. PLM1]
MGTRERMAGLARTSRLDRLARRGLGGVERLLGTLGGGRIIYLIGVAGHPNYGDELVLRIWLRHLARVRPTDTVIVDVAHVGEAALLFAHDHPRAVFVDTLWRLARAADEHPELCGDLSPSDWVASAASELGVAPGLAEGVDHLLRASSIHIVGGGYINGIWPQWLPVVSAVGAVARRTGARAYASGLGLLPLPDGAALARLRSDAAAFTVFDVRDRASFDALASVPGRSFTGDDVWLGLDVAASDVPARPGDVALCVQEDLSEGFAWRGLSGAEGLAAYVEAVLDAWRVPGENIVVVEGIPGHDYTVPKLLGARLDGARIIPFLDVWREGLPAGRGSRGSAPASTRTSWPRPPVTAASPSWPSRTTTGSSTGRSPRPGRAGPSSTVTHPSRPGPPPGVSRRRTVGRTWRARRRWRPGSTRRTEPAEATEPTEPGAATRACSGTGSAA